MTLYCIHKATQINQILHPDGFSEKLMWCDRCRTSWMTPRDPEPEVAIARTKE